jgi:hypothetical protein
MLRLSSYSNSHFISLCNVTLQLMRRSDPLFTNLKLGDDNDDNDAPHTRAHLLKMMEKHPSLVERPIVVVEARTRTRAHGGGDGGEDGDDNGSGDGGGGFVTRRACIGRPPHLATAMLQTLFEDVADGVLDD